MGLTAAVTAGLVLGLSAGGACFWTCASVLGPYVVCTDGAEGGPRWSSVPGALRTVAWYNLGRLAAYLVVGALLALLASQQPEIPVEARAVVRLLMAAVLTVVVIRPARPDRCPGARRRRGGALVLGLLQGLAPCPPFLSAAALALSAHNPLVPPVLFGALFVSTALYTLPVALVEPLRRSPLLAGATRVFGAAVALYMAVSGAALLLR